MKSLVRECLAAALGSFSVWSTAVMAEPLSVPAQVARTTERFLSAVRSNSEGDYRVVADGVEISFSDSDDKKLSLNQARKQFPDCELVGVSDPEDLGDTAFSFNGTIKCVQDRTQSQIVGVIADRERVYMVRPGGFRKEEDRPAEKAKAEADAQKTLDQLASQNFQVPAGNFKSWSERERHTIPGVVQNSCTYIWTMMHDASTHLLPDNVSGEDEWNLGIDVCLVGNMPTDWPDRDNRLRAARTALQRAATAGSALRLPAKIAP